MARDHRQLMSTIVVTKSDAHKAEVTKRKKRLRRKVEQALVMDQDARTIRSRLTIKAFRQEKENSKSDGAVLKYIKRTINTLIQFYSMTRTQLMVRYSKVDVGAFPPTVIFRQYELLLDRRVK